MQKKKIKQESFIKGILALIFSQILIKLFGLIYKFSEKVILILTSPSWNPSCHEATWLPPIQSELSELNEFCFSFENSTL